MQSLNLKRLFLVAAIAMTLTINFGSVAQTSMSKSVIDGWMQSLSNWGRWGAADQLGTLNLITPETRIAAAKLVRSGVSVSMAHETLVEEAADNANPYEHDMLAVGNSPGPWSLDSVGVAYHGYAHSHLDALCHRFHEGAMYNGFSESEVTSAGCGKLAITTAANGVFARGVLMDIARLKGVDWLDLDTAIMAEDLEAWEEQSGVKVGSGDVILVRTGRWARRAALGAWNVAANSAGLHASAVQWLRARDVSIVGTDVAADTFPSGVEGYTHPVHVMLLVAMGTPIFDNLDLEAVAEEAVAQNRWEFLLTTAPLRVEGGTGSPLNPIATF
ncbi:MAG: cyclase [SAR86 cluster bacterium]|uniref:Cyclase n=1 Tax=SAR86 cluster bacterium TaxID=2030880 RepID=A0A2A4MNL6_9GAMM|nr:MAG: cyclase [SAR86 cluster bacterium]